MNKKSADVTTERKVAVYHLASFMFRGGGESVAVHVLEALKHDYSVTLYTTGKKVNFDKINDYFGTDLSDEEIEIKYIDTKTTKVLTKLLDWTCSRLTIDTAFLRLRVVIYDRVFSQMKEGFDLVIDTFNESLSNLSEIDYIHFPLHDREVANQYCPDVSDFKHIQFYKLYNRFIYFLSPGCQFKQGEKTFLVNSKWTGRAVKDAHGGEPIVVYPPVKTDDFRPLPWDKKEDGFLLIGRIEGRKRTLKVIEIIDGVNEQYGTHLHIIGNIPDNEYADKVRKKAEERDYVHLEGKVSRERLVDMVNSHRYGIHGTEAEHFGIAVAEMVAGGCIPFVPDDGGQVEIVNEDPNLTYHDTEDAVEKIVGMLEDPELQIETLEGLENRAEEFSEENFRRKIRRIVAREIDNRAPRIGTG